jgi:uncharacterized protein DUF4389
MSYPVAVIVNQDPKRSRLTTFFRIILVIPWAIVLYILEIVWFIVVVIAWFALLFTARWPQSLYDFSVGVLRFQARTTGYLVLLTDDFPPFGLGDDDYALRVVADPPLDQYSRLKVFFRILYALPAAIIAYVMQIALELIAIAAWVVIVITGRQPDGLQNALRFCWSYVIKAYALMFLITETYPPFDDGGAAVGPAGPSAPVAEGGADPLASWKAEG